MRIETVDLNFMGTEHVIASSLLLVETGPTTCLEHLMGGLEEHNVPPKTCDRSF